MNLILLETSQGQTLKAEIMQAEGLGCPYLKKKNVKLLDAFSLMHQKELFKSEFLLELACRLILNVYSIYRTIS